MSYFFGIIALFVFGTAYLNFESSKRNTRNTNAFVKDHFENVRYHTKYLLLDFEGRIERFQPSESEWNQISKNDTINLTIGQGELGYEHILFFIKK